MTSENSHWTKTELQVYILLLCAKADSVASQEELDLIKTKVDNSVFEKMFEVIAKDEEDDSLEKISDNLSWHNYSPREIKQLKVEMQEVFMADNKVQMKESSLEDILDNILY